MFSRAARLPSRTGPRRPHVRPRRAAAGSSRIAPRCPGDVVRRRRRMTHALDDLLGVLAIRLANTVAERSFVGLAGSTIERGQVDNRATSGRPARQRLLHSPGLSVSFMLRRHEYRVGQVRPTSHLGQNELVVCAQTPGNRVFGAIRARASRPGGQLIDRVAARRRRRPTPPPPLPRPRCRAAYPRLRRPRPGSDRRAGAALAIASCVSSGRSGESEPYAEQEEPVQVRPA